MLISYNTNACVSSIVSICVDWTVVKRMINQSHDKNNNTDNNADDHHITHTWEKKLFR